MTTTTKKPTRAERRTQRQDAAIARQRALINRGYYYRVVVDADGAEALQRRTPAPISQFVRYWR